MSYFLVVRRYAPFSSFGGGFEGDVRVAGSVNPNATARTIGVITFDALGVQAFMGFSSGSTFEGAGQWISRKIGRSFAQVKTVLSNESTALSSISFTVHTAGANPLVPIAAPDIDTFVDVSVTFDPNGLVVSGHVRGDSFPNAEVILLDEALSGELLFDFHTSGGRQTGPARLFGANAASSLGRFQSSVAVANGRFVAPKPACAPTVQARSLGR
jgi:hypothetical protein